MQPTRSFQAGITRLRLVGLACLLVALVVGGVVVVRSRNATGTPEIAGRVGTNGIYAYYIEGLQDWADTSDAIAIIEITSEQVSPDWDGKFDEHRKDTPRQVTYEVEEVLYSNRTKPVDNKVRNGEWSDNNGKRYEVVLGHTWLEVGKRYLVSFHWSDLKTKPDLIPGPKILLSGDKLIEADEVGFKESTVQELMMSLSRTPLYQEPGVDLSTCSGLDRKMLRLWAKNGHEPMGDRSTILARCVLPSIVLPPITVPGVATTSVSVPPLSIPTASVPPVTVPSVSLPGPTSTTTSSSLPATSASTSTTVANP